nr:MAG TPA: hypothetical protein [Caudoviricetes sp.]
MKFYGSRQSTLLYKLYNSDSLWLYRRASSSFDIKAKIVGYLAFYRLSPQKAPSAPQKTSKSLI